MYLQGLFWKFENSESNLWCRHCDCEAWFIDLDALYRSKTAVISEVTYPLPTGGGLSSREGVNSLYHDVHSAYTEVLSNLMHKGYLADIYWNKSDHSPEVSRFMKISVAVNFLRLDDHFLTLFPIIEREVFDA